jgi:hypothetical protein
MDQVTEEQVRAELPTDLGKPDAFWSCRICSLCYHPIGYHFHPDGRVGFDGSCGCTDLDDFREVPLSQVVELFNMQHPHVRAKMWGEFVEAVHL